jgi:hypothetical protein
MMGVVEVALLGSTQIVREDVDQSLGGRVMIELDVSQAVT